MRCEYCGKDLPIGTTVCDGCGAKYESNVPNTQGGNNFYVNNNPNGSKKGGSKIIIIVVLVVLALVLAGVGIWYVVSNNDKKESSNEEKNPVEDKDDDKESDNDKLKTVTFGDYTLSIPKGFETGIQDNNPYIANNECLIMYFKFPANYNDVLNNKDTFIENLEASGMKIDLFDTITFKGQKFITMRGVMNSNNAEFGYMIADLDSNTPILLTILSSKLLPFEDDWFDCGAQFVASARK